MDLARAQLSYVTNRGNEAPGLLVKAAKKLENSDPELARATYLDALSAAIFAGRLASPGGASSMWRVPPRTARSRGSTQRTGTPPRGSRRELQQGVSGRCADDAPCPG